ncbi:hypothetical protein RJ640_012049 [Escallonia rubra]|uniref:BED-type domain-containing protein n=1 Tax=Escallonia rubra TaxID=112253 RepID=A0AA88R1K0_9ASTE|nr:hypothetical protein RJ640_012049 [Escallonia rubra]
MEEGSATTRPPLLKNDNYSCWKNRMRNFLRQDSHVWYVVENGPIIPMKDGPDETKISKGILKMDAHEAHLFSMDDKAKYIINYSLDMNEYNRVSTCETAGEMWRTGHIKRYCPQLKNKTASSNSRDFKEKKFKSRKALLTWDDSNESDKETSEDDDVTQLCFMANDDNSDKSKGKALIMSEPVGEDAIGEVEVNTMFKRRERKKTSPVWDFFVDVTLANGTKKVKCKLCNAILNKTKGGTTTQLLRHRDTYCPKRGIAVTNQSVINVKLGKMEYEVSKKDFKYNHAKVREAAAQMILVHEYPFNMMEHEFFNRFMRTATLYYESISRETAKSDVMETYEKEKKSLKATFLSVSKVESKKNIELVSGSLLEVYKEYVLNHALHCSNVTKESSVMGGSSNTTSTYKAKRKTKYDLYVRSMENVMPIKSDLETYLEEGVYICEVNLESQFDVIGWWKANNLKHKILSKIAVDILSIPITTVASEAAFSTGGRVIDPYRASLSTKTVEALICGGDWIRSLYGVKEDKIKEEIVTFVVIAWDIPV